MVIEFTIKNFRSFKNEATLSMVAEGLSGNKTGLIETSHGLNLLPSSVIFGANASGKSNLLKALGFMLQVMANTNISKPTTGLLLLLPFELDAKTAKQPAFMQIILWDQSKEREYRYGFEINKDNVVSEWLHYKSRVKTNFTNKPVFSRNGQDFNFGSGFDVELRDLAPRVNNKLLALPIFAQLNHNLALDLVKFTNENLLGVYNSRSFEREGVAGAIEICAQDPDIQHFVTKMIGSSDLAIQSIKVIKEQYPLKDEPDEIKEQFRRQGATQEAIITNRRVITQHKMRNSKELTKDFHLLNHESSGTVKLFILTTLLMRAFKHGGVLIIDELDASLHPIMVQAVVDCLKNKRLNQGNTQLIFSSHATYLLSRQGNIRRDQVWFTEKNNREESTLKCLSEYKIRNDYEIARNYLMGRFDAIPIIDPRGLGKDIG